MNTKTLLIGVGAVVVVGAVVMFTMSSKTPGTSSNTSGDTTQNQEKTLKGLLGVTSPQQCTFTEKNDVSESSGTVYVVSGRMRGDFDSVAAGTRQKSHMIIAGDTSYIWTDSAKQGFKMPIPEKQEPGKEAPKGSVDINQQVTYSCNPWTVQEIYFALPTDVTFSSMSDMMKNMPGGIVPNTKTGTIQNPNYSDVKKAQCGACDQAPEPSRSQCRAALGC